MPTLKPLRDYILIRHDPEEEGLVVKPQSIKDYSPIMATVLAVGDGHVTDRGIQALAVVEGDRVLVETRYAGIAVELDEGGKLMMVHEQHIMGVIR
jgi:co-chaperonin GroES (HSP10)